MGCGSSQPEIDYGSIALAMKKQDEELRKEKEAAKKKEEAKVYNTEPSPGFRSLSIGNPDDVVKKETEKKEAPKWAKEPSAAHLVRDEGNRERANQGAHHLRNVFAKPLSREEVASFHPPKFEKSREEVNFIAKILKGNFVFCSLTQRQMHTMLDAFERVDYEKGHEIIKQGEEGDFFYVIRSGSVYYEVDGVVVGNSGAGTCFGELALLYSSPRAASVLCDTKCALYRVDQSTFRYIMQTQREQAESDKRQLLESVSFLQELDITDMDRLADAMIPRRFQAGEYLARKGDEADTFFVIQEGKVLVKDIDAGMTNYEDHELGPGQCFGEGALLHDQTRMANFIGKTQGLALSIEKQMFDRIVGNFAILIHRSQDKKRLRAIKIIKNSYYSEATLASLASLIQDQQYPPRTEIVKENAIVPAALYLVREGRVELKREDGRGYKVIEEGGYFGDEQLTQDTSGLKSTTDIKSLFTIATLGQPTKLGVLTLEDVRKIVDTTMIGRGERTDFTSIVDSDIPLKSLKKHAILGAGTFGQVWLVSKVAPDGTNRPYALKIQSKYELVKTNQAKGVVQERNIMVQLNCPFVIRLVQTYQDAHFIYMLLGLVQGGELYSLIHQNGQGGISEKDCKFYASCILEGLTYLHRRQIVYRDLKPENVLIAYGGYPVIVDLGFAKRVEKKTYTLCGTPLYLAPEVILNLGHDKGADHWSWAVLVYEMVASYTPFYAKGIDQITLYRFIVKGEFRFPSRGNMSANMKDLITKMLVVQPRKRLGSMAGGIEEIYAHSWFLDMDFPALRRKEIKAPWEPEIKDPLDKSKFENWDHLKVKSKDDFPELPPRHQAIFKDF